MLFVDVEVGAGAAQEQATAAASNSNAAASATGTAAGDGTDTGSAPSQHPSSNVEDFVRQQVSKAIRTSASSRRSMGKAPPSRGGTSRAPRLSSSSTASRPHTASSKASSRPRTGGPLKAHKPLIKREKYVTPGPGAFDPDPIRARLKTAPSFSIPQSHTAKAKPKRGRKPEEQGSSSKRWWDIDDAVLAKLDGGSNEGSTGRRGGRLKSKTPKAGYKYRSKGKQRKSRGKKMPAMSPVAVTSRPRTSSGRRRATRRSDPQRPATSQSDKHDAEASERGGYRSGVRLTVMTEGENVAPGVGTYQTPTSAFGRQRVGTAKSGARATFGTASKSSIGALYLEGMMQAPPASAVYAKQGRAKTPGVGDYNPRKVQLRRAPSFGFSTAPRSKVDGAFAKGAKPSEGATPKGARRTTTPSKTPTALKRTVSRRTMEAAHPATPGPSDYDWAAAKDRAKLSRTPSQSFSKATRFKWSRKGGKGRQPASSEQSGSGEEEEEEEEDFASAPDATAAAKAFDTKLSRHKSSPAFSIPRTGRTPMHKSQSGTGAHGVDVDITKQPKHRGHTFARSGSRGDMFATKAVTPGPSDYTSFPLKSLGAKQTVSSRRTQPGVVFGAKTSKAPPPGSARAVWGGKSKGKKAGGKKKSARVVLDDEGNPVTPGPTDHVVDMGMGRKQVLSHKRGTPSARIGTERRGFSKLYTHKRDVSGKGDINSNPGAVASVPAPWDYNPSPTVGGRAASKTPAFTFAGSKTTYSRKALRAELQAAVSGSTKKRGGKKQRRGKGTTRKAQRQKNKKVTKKLEASAMGLKRPSSRARVIGNTMMPHSISTDAGPGAYHTDSLDKFGSRNVTGARRNTPSATFGRSNRAKHAKVVAPGSIQTASADTPGPGAYHKQKAGTGQKHVLSKHRSSSNVCFPTAARAQAPIAPEVQPVSTLQTPAPSDYNPHVAFDRVSSKSRKPTSFQFGTSKRGTIEVDIG